MPNSLTSIWTPWTPASNEIPDNGPGGPVTSGRVLLIAEIANSHEGRAADAVEMIQAASKAGCDAVKFQKYYASEMLAAGHSMMSTFSGWEWEPHIWRQLIETAHEAGLRAFVDVFGPKAYQSLAEFPEVDGLKIHGSDVSNVPFLEQLAGANCPILIGTGGCSDLDIYQAVSTLGHPERLVLMHGYQGFPCPLEDTALRRISYLRDSFGLAVGLSDHLDAGNSFAKVAPLMAVPLGVCCIEKHITLDRASGGVDHESSLNPDEMEELAGWLRQAELALGQVDLPLSASESGYRRRFKKSLVTATPVSTGESIRREDLTYKIVQDPARYPLHLTAAVGQSAERDLPEGTLLSAKDLKVSTGLCIVARLKSQRLPRKALADIHGKPALLHLMERAQLCSGVERSVLCTSTDPEDAPLIQLAREHGFTVYAGSPDQPLERLIACAEMYGWQFVIRATGDNIFLDPALLAQAVDLAAEQNLDYVSMGSVPVGTHCEVFSTFSLRTTQTYADAPYTTEYLTWFVADNPNFRTADLDVPEELRRNYRLTLDTPDDLINIRDVAGRLAEIPGPYTLADVIRTVESDPDLLRRCTPQEAMPAPPTKVKFNFRVFKS